MPVMPRSAFRRAATLTGDADATTVSRVPCAAARART